MTGARMTRSCADAFRIASRVVVYRSAAGVEMEAVGAHGRPVAAGAAGTPVRYASVRQARTAAWRLTAAPVVLADVREGGREDGAV